MISAIQRALYKTLFILNPVSILGDPMNYQTIKDLIFVQVLTSKLN